MIVTALYKVYAIWTFCCTENKAFMKFASGFIEPQVLNFERSLSLSPGPKAVMFRLAKFLLVAVAEVEYIYFRSFRK